MDHATPTISGGSPVSAARRSLRRITCPHCWHRFAPEKILWISRHGELVGDQVVGAEAPTRFLPTRFTIDGQAIDARGMACHWLACPVCHLSIVRDMLDLEPLFMSIIGVPSSGKSYFLAAMIWELRRLMTPRFGVSFTDADTVSNRVLNEYEEALFLGGDKSIRKTELQGELYDGIKLGQQIVSLPRPFLFAIRPPAQKAGASTSGRILCLYDNAGEHFQPGMDSTASPVTQHLAKSRVLMFLFDPTQNARMREKCRTVSDDPQLASSRQMHRQDTVLTETALRVRRYTGLSSAQKLDRPLLVLVTKSDIWAPLLKDVDITTEPIVDQGAAGAMDIRRVEQVSARIKALLQDLTPEFVAAAADVSQYVLYVPISAYGRSPEAVTAPIDGVSAARKPPEPRWVTVPMLYTFAKWSNGLVPAANKPRPGGSPLGSIKPQA